MKKVMALSLDAVLHVFFEVCRAFVIWYMYRQNMPGIRDIETWLVE